MRNLSELVINAGYFKREFPSEEPALKYLDEMRWGSAPRCPCCDSGKNTGTGSRKGWHRCYNYKCGRQFTSKHGTIFAGSLIPLHKWFLGAYYMMRLNGAGTIELSDELGISRVSAWHMAQRICMAMGKLREGAMLRGIVECDEAVFGGLEEYKHSKKRLWTRGSWGGKQGAFCMVERGEAGRAITLAVPSKPAENPQGKPITMPDFSKEILHGMIKRHVDLSSIIITDCNTIYSGLARDGLARLHFAVSRDEPGYAIRVSHPEIEEAHTRTVAIRFKSLKHGIGSLRGWDRKYFQRCLDAADFRQNETKIFGEDGKLLRRAPTKEAFETFIKLCFGMPLDRDRVML